MCFTTAENQQQQRIRSVPCSPGTCRGREGALCHRNGPHRSGEISEEGWNIMSVSWSWPKGRGSEHFSDPPGLEEGREGLLDAKAR